MDPNLILADWYGKEIEIKIDRPLGSKHPQREDLIYEVNYGFVEGTLAPDGAEIDVYVLGAEHPLERCRAKVIGIARRRDDIEDKLIAAMSGDWPLSQIEAAVAFQERWFDTWIELPQNKGQRVCG